MTHLLHRLFQKDASEAHSDNACESAATRVSRNPLLRATKKRTRSSFGSSWGRKKCVLTRAGWPGPNPNPNPNPTAHPPHIRLGPTPCGRTLCALAQPRRVRRDLRRLARAAPRHRAARVDPASPVSASLHVAAPPSVSARPCASMRRGPSWRACARRHSPAPRRNARALARESPRRRVVRVDLAAAVASRHQGDTGPFHGGTPAPQRHG